MSFGRITPEELRQRQQRGESVELLDVRTPIEFREVHATIARNVPLDQIDADAIMAARNGSADQPLYLICRAGARSCRACEQFVAAGYDRVVSVEGGTDAWVRAGLDVVRGKKAISLQRQVQIIAGLLIVVGSLLAFLLHPYWIALPASVGLGLLLTGITDTCMMGLMLAKMPWNRVP